MSKTFWAARKTIFNWTQLHPVYFAIYCWESNQMILFFCIFTQIPPTKKAQNAYFSLSYENYSHKLQDDYSKGKTHPCTNIKPLSNQQGIYCVAIMPAQWVWTPAMCSVQHKRDNLRSWPSSSQTVAAALKSVTLLLPLPQMAQAAGELSTLSTGQRTRQPECRFITEPGTSQGNKKVNKTTDMCASNWANELELQGKRKREEHNLRKDNGEQVDKKWMIQHTSELETAWGRRVEKREREWVCVCVC